MASKFRLEALLRTRGHRSHRGRRQITSPFVPFIALPFPHPLASFALIISTHSTITLSFIHSLFSQPPAFKSTLIASTPSTQFTCSYSSPLQPHFFLLLTIHPSFLCQTSHLLFDSLIPSLHPRSCPTLSYFPLSPFSYHPTQSFPFNSPLTYQPPSPTYHPTHITFLFTRPLDLMSSPPPSHPLNYITPSPKPSYALNISAPFIS